MSNAYAGDEARGVPAAPRAEAAAEESLDLFGLFRVMRRRIGLIIVVFALIASCGGAAVMSLGKTYTAQSRLMIEPPLAAGLDEAQGQAKALNLDVEIARLTARDVSLGVIERLRLAERAEFNAALRPPSLVDQLRARLRPAAAATGAAASLEDGVLLAYYGALSIGRAGTADILAISFTSEDPHLAAAVPNMLVEIYLAHREAALKARAGEAVTWLDTQIAAQRTRLETARAAARTFRDEAGLSPGAARGEGSETIAALTARRADIIRERADVTARLSILDGTGDEARRAALIDGPALTDLRRVQQGLARDLDQLLETYGNNYAGVRDVRARIAETEAAIRDEEARYGETLKTRLAALGSEEQAVLDGMELARRSLSRQSAAEAEAEGLVRVVDAEQVALDRLEAQRRSVGMSAALPVAEAEMLAPATVPLGPDGRSKLFYLAVVAVVAAGIAVTLAFVRELFDSSIRSRQQLASLLPNAPAALLPHLPRRFSRDAPRNLKDVRGHTFADAVRGLTLVLGSGPSVGGPIAGSIAVLSALPGEGKSFVAYALAAELSSAGRRVLLVDGDLRQGRLHHIFGAKSGPGLAEYFAGQANLADVRRFDAATGIEYVTRGGMGGAVFYHRDRLAELLRTAAEERLVVVVDSAPVLATTDTALLAALVERDVFVVRWGTTTHRAVEAALQRLPEGVAGRLRVAINGVDPSRHALYGFDDAQQFSCKLRRYHRRAR